MFCIDYSTDPTDDYSGRLGLGRPGTSSTGEPYVKKLYEGSVISEEKFSIEFDYDFYYSDSYIDYGPPDTTAFDTNLYVEIPMIGNNFWQQTVDGFYFEDYPDKPFKTQALNGIFTSGNSYVSMPKTELEFI